MRWLCFLAAFLMLAPLAQAQVTIDFFIDISEDGTPSVDAPEDGVVAPVDAHFRERYSWNLTLTKDYTTAEIRIHPAAMDIERARQVVPSLDIDPSETLCGPGGKDRGPCAYPLFESVPRVEIWDVDGPARIANHSTQSDGTIILRLGFPGPVNATLILQRDVTPPSFTIGAMRNLTHVDFYQETDTDELAIGDIQVRKLGATEWIVNPTTVLHYRQQFPVQGLDADTEYEQRFIFTDWAGNVAEGPTTTFRTKALPIVPLPTITPLSPGHEENIPRGVPVVVRARIESPESPVHEEGVRLFYDLREVTDGISFTDGIMTFTPPTATDGAHVVRVEVTNEAGGKTFQRWTFSVGEEPTAETPAPGIFALLAGIAAISLITRRRR